MSHLDRARSLRALLPPGPIWDQDPELWPQCKGLSAEAARNQADLEKLVEDFFPDTSVNFLADWERLLGLKPGDLTDAERRTQILAKLRGYGDPSLPNITAIVAAFGRNAVIENRPYSQFIVGTSAMGTPLRGDDWVSTMRITYDGPSSPQLEAAVSAALPLNVTPEFLVR